MQNSELKEIFNNIIIPEAKQILTENYGLLFIDNAFELFLFEYRALHEYYLKKYMNPNSKGLDSHKEISTILISLLKVKPLKTVHSDYYATNSARHAFNETLAFRVGCDILKTIIKCDYEQNKELSDEERVFCINEIENSGLVLPKTTYQNYAQNSITEFYYTSREGSYNFLGLSDKFFWIEYFNKRKIKAKYLEYQKKAGNTKQSES